MKMSKVSKTTYIEPNLIGEPAWRVAQLAVEVASMAGLDALPSHYPALNSYPGVGRKKVRITVTVEEIK